MTQYIVNVPLLNVRKRIPPQMPDTDGVTGKVKKNFIFEGQEVPVEQVEHLGMDKWYQDTNKNFYWGGGVNENPASVPNALTAPSDIINYPQLLGLPGKIINTAGNDIVVAILDSGCAVHSALKDKIVAAYDAMNNTAAPMIDDNSTIGHGTFVAGLIAAGEATGATMLGMAPGVKLIIIRVIEDLEGLDILNVVKALKWLRDECPIKPHIINMSFNCVPDGHEGDMDDLINGFTKGGTVLIAAGQDDAAAFNDAQIFYPARHDSVLGVACVDAITIPGSSPLSTKIQYLSPNITFSSTGMFDDYVGGFDYKGCSFTAALTSGLFALVLRYLRESGDHSSASNLVNTLFRNFDSSNFSNTLNLYKNETPI